MDGANTGSANTSHSNVELPTNDGERRGMPNPLFKYKNKVFINVDKAYCYIFGLFPWTSNSIALSIRDVHNMYLIILCLR